MHETGHSMLLHWDNPEGWDGETNEDLAFYATDSFTKFYAIARNLGTRSLNIDNNSVFFFGKLKQQKI